MKLKATIYSSLLNDDLDTTIPTGRISGIRDFLVAEPVSICLERPTLMRKSRLRFEYLKEKHPAVRRALTLSYIMSHRIAVIYEGELIAGNMTSKRIAANYYPEGGSSQILEDIFCLGSRKTVPIKMSFVEKTKLFYTGIRLFFDSVGWHAFGRPDRILNLWKYVFNAKRFILTELAGVSHQIPDYGTVVAHGLKKADLLALKALESGTNPKGNPLDENQIAFYRSVRIIIKGISEMASNLSKEASRLKELPGTDPKRKTELEEISESLKHVPYEPARSFKEGLQACWLLHVCMNLEDFEQGLSFGRLDQILYPLFRADMDSGKIDFKSAAELIASFQLKACETVPLFSRKIDAYFSGNTVGQGITLGGVDEKGDDCTNELSGLFLDAFRQIKTREPNLHVRIHEMTPSWFMDKCIEMLKCGCGSPAFFGDTAVIKALKKAGMTEEHARDYAVIGCVELGSQGRTYHSSDAGLFNLPLCLEMALNEGRSFGSLKREGAKTPHPETMKSFEDLVKAFRIQVSKMIDDAVEAINHLEKSYAEIRTSPLNSILTKGALEQGYDVTWGGGVYDFTSLQIVGLADTGDSLYAIKRLIFDEKRMSLKDLAEILKNDFNGIEMLSTELKNRFPKFGNGDKEVDSFVQLAADAFTSSVNGRMNTRGGRYLSGVYSMTCHTAFGRLTGAMASGRRKGAMLSNGLSPATGSDKNGPTAVFRSASFIDNSDFGNCLALNIRFESSFMEGPLGKKIASGLLYSYLVDHKGMQVQVNVVDAETLIAAKKNPEDFPGLLVRVAGYCAYFNDLEPSAQDEIIRRTAHA